MQILHISDTHNKHHLLTNLPPADIIIHSGDITFAGSEVEVDSFIKWFYKLNYKHKVFIGGNHDDYLFESYDLNLPPSCHYLNHSGIEIDGITFWGVPLFMQELNNESFDKNISNIPSYIDVLITHQPPKSILDTSGGWTYGSQILLEKVIEIKPILHLFGHIHDANGIYTTEETVFSNASVLDENYNLKFKPKLFEI